MKSCPLCNSASERVFEVKNTWILDCQVCGHRFADITADIEHVEKTYDDSYFYDGNAGYADYTIEADMLRKRGRQYAKKIAKHVNKGRMLDVGAAAGFILKGFEDEGWSGVGLEPNPSMAEYGKTKLGLNMNIGTLEMFDKNERFDLVSMVQVVGHLFDPSSAFASVKTILSDGGHLLIESWDRASFSARILGKHWHEYSPPSVLHWYSHQSLVTYLSGIGFEEIAYGRTLKKISGKRAKSLLQYRLGFKALFSPIPDSLSLPYPSEDLFWTLLKYNGTDHSQ
ncbi:MAG: class I SAM-dependent methyltransferase [Acidobacteria bacterium]|nr:class I SAM-dependent methyltransferase [Acidobacteriota bacterium]